MTEQDYELLSQYLDGELASPEAQALRRRLLAEPELRGALDRMRHVDDKVKNTFDIPGVDEVPPAVAARLRSDDPVVPAVVTPIRGATAALAASPAPWKMALAASLVAAAGLLLAPSWQQNAEQGEMGAFPDNGLLSAALENSPSSSKGWDTLEDGRQLRPVLSFASREGSWCREYLLAGTGSTYRGVACRTGGDWNTVVFAETEIIGSNNEYRPAGAGDSDLIATYINSHASDIPLGRSQERRLIANQWQQQ